MKNILLIDDLRNFRDDPTKGGNVLVIARTSEEALTVLKADRRGWDEIWFDHDLGLKSDGRIDSTMSVVDYLVQRSYEDDPIPVSDIFIHTSNPVGGGNIMTSLNRWGYNAYRVSAAPVFIVEDENFEDLPNGLRSTKKMR